VSTTIEVLPGKSVNLDEIDLANERVQAKLLQANLNSLDIDGLKAKAEQFATEACLDVPYNIVVEFSTAYSLQALRTGQAETVEEAWKQSFEAVKNGSIEYLMFIAGGSYGTATAALAAVLAA
jgi:hypothetical protein